MSAACLQKFSVQRITQAIKNPVKSHAKLLIKVNLKEEESFFLVEKFLRKKTLR